MSHRRDISRMEQPAKGNALLDCQYRTGRENNEMNGSSWTALVFRDEGWWIGWIAEIPGANAQERTCEELLDSLTEVLREALEELPC